MTATIRTILQTGIVITGLTFFPGVSPVTAQTSTESQILSQNDYALYQQHYETLYSDFGTVEKERIISFIVAAYLRWVKPYIYVWNGQEYEIRDVFDKTGALPIDTANGFFLQTKRDFSLWICPMLDPPPAPALVPLTLESNRYYFISTPLVPANGDFETNFGAVLGPGEYEQTWRFSKWNYETRDYDRYNGPGTFPELLSGRGFWVVHIKNEPRTITFTGTPFPPLTICKVNIPTISTQWRDHMAGNPFHYPITAWNLFLDTKMDDSLPLAKAAAETSVFDNLQSWYIGLEARDVTSQYIDTYNRAGVIEAGEDIHDVLTAEDFEPPGDFDGNFVRLAVKNPADVEGIPLAYDYRGPGLDEYIWNVELTTGMKSADVKLHLTNVASVLDAYDVTLLEQPEGETWTITGDTSINLQISSDAPKTFVLKVVKVTTRAGEDPAPAPLNITSVAPNPFNPVTSVSFTVHKPGRVTIRIYNVRGQLVETLADSHMNAGSHSILWNASRCASGVYLVRLESGGYADTQKVTLMK